MEQNNKKSNTFYTVALKGMVAYPKMVMHFDAAREKTINAVERAVKGDGYVFLVAQEEIEVEKPTEKDLFKVGVVAEIKQILKLPDNVVKVLVEGMYRAEMTSLTDEGDVLLAQVKRVPTYSRSKYNELEAEALVRTVKDIFERYTSFFPKIPRELLSAVMAQSNPVKLFEAVCFNSNINYRDKQALLEETNIIRKLTLLATFLAAEVEILELENEINEQTRMSIDKGQREYYLREQMRIIQEQLGDDEVDEVYELREKIIKLKIDEKSRDKLIRETDRLAKLPSASQEAFVIKNYLDTVLSLPWGKYTKTKISMDKAETILDDEHYGLKKVKERILEFLAVHTLNPDIKGQIICLAGPPGIGKTSIARSIAKAMGRKYVRVSLGGVRDEADIRGHRKTYVGAMPGRIMAAMEQAGTADPMILLDEIDKLCSDIKGDP